MGDPGCKCRRDGGLGWCGKVHARQPLAPGDGCRTLSFCYKLRLWLVLLLGRALTGGSSTADEFLDMLLTWFGDPDPKIGTALGEG